jgi:hypothetical protein
MYDQGYDFPTQISYYTTIGLDGIRLHDHLALVPDQTTTSSTHVLSSLLTISVSKLSMARAGRTYKGIKWYNLEVTQSIYNIIRPNSTDNIAF